LFHRELHRVTALETKHAQKLCYDLCGLTEQTVILCCYSTCEGRVWSEFKGGIFKRFQEILALKRGWSSRTRKGRQLQLYSKATEMVTKKSC